MSAFFEVMEMLPFFFFMLFRIMSLRQRIYNIQTASRAGSKVTFQKFLKYFIMRLK